MFQSLTEGMQGYAAALIGQHVPGGNDARKRPFDDLQRSQGGDAGEAAAFVQGSWSAAQLDHRPPPLLPVCDIPWHAIAGGGGPEGAQRHLGGAVGGRSNAALLAEGPESSLGVALTRDITARAVTTATATSAAWATARLTGRAKRARTVALAALVGAQLGQTVALGGTSPAVLASTAGLVPCSSGSSRRPA